MTATTEHNEGEVEAALAGLWGPDGRRDPHPYYHRIRRIAPIVKLPTPNSWMLTRHADCAAVLQEPKWLSLGEVYSARSKQAEATDDALPEGLELLNLVQPVESHRIRPVVNRFFSTAALKAQRTRIAEVVDSLLDPIAEEETVELLSEYAEPLPLTVTCELLGLPASDHELFASWSYEAAKLLHGEMPDDARSRSLAAAFELVNYLNPLIEQRRTDPGDDLLSALAANTGADGLTETELRSFAVLLFMASQETTSNLIANGVHTLLQHPDQLERLRDDPSLVVTAAEEMLRYEGSVTAAPRYASEELVIGAHRFRPGSEVIVSLIAANRDPEVFPDPDRFDIGRRPNPHLGFGKGPHHCLGAALARLIIQESVLRLVQRFPELHEVEPGPAHRQHLVMRGFEELRLALR